MKNLTYKEKFIQMNKEAKASWIVAAVIIVFWWIGGFGVYNLFGEDFFVFSMPAWFVISCFGSWILSIALVFFLIKKIYKDFDLEDKEEIQSESTSGKGENIK